jgi:ribosomal protein S12 methylthiotransferase
VLVDSPGTARSHREAPEIDGIIAVPAELAVGNFATVRITGADGPDLEAVGA